ncbi:hypothetical protein O6H91_06G027200 [Diphasiastrum complanatum]|uniref:Uncharacterized protein n=1 Tax=Diphasiastrum complanatum TaxID=34168 RepID=A0ACC2DBV9_DIPCM|nr:hypothetical protein O6H91_06G027200 [Diphasiastrum complanatum]
MYAVGRLGNYISQGVYTVSAPFQPFGGAVDIIVVQQEDGSFKSTPWSVRFGKFQGVLKQLEAQVDIAVNDVDADFHMYLDSTGEAYFLQDSDSDVDEAVLSLSSSRDETSATLTPQINKPEDESNQGDIEQEISRQFASEQEIVKDVQFIEEEHGLRPSITESDSFLSELAIRGSEDVAKSPHGSGRFLKALPFPANELPIDQSGIDGDYNVKTKVVLMNVDGQMMMAPLASLVKRAEALKTSSDTILKEPSESEAKIGQRVECSGVHAGFQDLLDTDSELNGGSTFTTATFSEGTDAIQAAIEGKAANISIHSNLERNVGAKITQALDEASYDSQTSHVGMEGSMTADLSSCSHVSVENNDREWPRIAEKDDIDDVDVMREVKHNEDATYSSNRPGNFLFEKPELFFSFRKMEDIDEDIGSHSGRYYDAVDEDALTAFENLPQSSLSQKDESGMTRLEQSHQMIETGSAMTSAGGWKLWPFLSRRTPAIHEVSPVVSQHTQLSSTRSIAERPFTIENSRTNEYRGEESKGKVRIYVPSSQQLAGLKLQEGKNKITFSFFTRVLGRQQVDARVYLWKWNARIVISDVDGTITRSDVLGQVMPLVGKDWTQTGVTRLFTAIKDNGYQLMFLSARAISQAYLTRQFLLNLKQDGEPLPDGPVVISPDGLFPSFYREVIRRTPHEFKIVCLQGIRSLFPLDCNPFYAGFGNRDTDEISYLNVGIPGGKIFIINPKGEVIVNNMVGIKTYTSLHKLVHDIFPMVTNTEQDGTLV